MLTMVLGGLWHGASWVFVIWGAYHGLGISILTVYQRAKKKIRLPIVQKYFRSQISHLAGIIVTFHYFTFGLSLFVLDLGRLRILVSHLLGHG